MMMMSRRVLGLAAATFATLQFIGVCNAQDYPDRAITYVVPSSAGSAVDTLARIVADGLSREFGQPVVVENRPGAGGNVGAAAAAEAPPDGYTILQVNNNHTANVTLYDNLTYNLFTDFVPVTRLASSPYIFVVNPSFPVSSLGELVDLAKSRPGEINYASAGVGSGTFMVTELLKSQAGIDLMHIPYEGGGPAIASVVAGETMVYGAPLATAMPFIDAGELRALAVSSPERVPSLPKYPAVAESVPGYEFTAWGGLMLPAETPQEIRDIVHQATLKALRDPDVSERLTELGYIVIGDNPDQFAGFLKNEVDTTAKLIKENNLKPN